MSEIQKNKHGAYVESEPPNTATPDQWILCLWELLRVWRKLTPDNADTKQMRANNTFVQNKIWPLAGVRPTPRKHEDEESFDYIIAQLKRAGITPEDLR